MKVKGLLVAAVATMICFGAQNASAIEAPNHEGDFNLNVMAGFLSEYSGGIGANVSGDYVLVNSWWKGHFTVGGFLEFNKTTDKDWVPYVDMKYTNFAVMARATYGLNITDKFEVHAGALAGLGFIAERIHYDTTAIEDARANTLRPCLGGLAGVRYFFSDSFGVTAEFNYSNYGALANVGVAFKF